MQQKITPAIVNLFIARAIAAHTQYGVNIGASQDEMFPRGAMDILEQAVLDAFDEFDKHGIWAGLVREKTDG
jgi:hypothetical protein